MLDKKRIRLMARMAAYEKAGAKEDLKITSYYKKDYASMNTWITLLWVTAGYVIAAALFVICNFESLLKIQTASRLLMIVSVAVGVYFVLLIIYAVCASAFYKNKHSKAKRRVKRYYRDLLRLYKPDKTEMKEKR